MRALRLEMLADTPLAFLETLAQAAARPHEAFRQRVAQAAAGGRLAQFVADPGGRSRLIGHAGGTVLPEAPGETVIFAVYVTPEHRGGKVLAELVEAVAGWARARASERDAQPEAAGSPVPLRRSLTTFSVSSLPGTQRFGSFSLPLASAAA